MQKHKYLKQIILVLAVTLIFNLIVPVAACAGKKKTVRVGWHEPPYFITDESGRKSGYSYEYQCKVAAYTGWDYEYVKGSWSALLQMLKDGEIDLLSDVSYTEERTGDMLFSSIPMGTETYYLFVSPDNREITSDGISALNGKKVGVAKGSIQKEYFLDWAEMHGIQADIAEMDCTEEESMLLLGSEIDAFVTMDVYGTSETAVPVCKVGSSDFYFAVNKKRFDLLAELDTALNKIQDENKYYDQQLHEKYLKSTKTARYIGNTERKWLKEHETIRIGYQDNYLAFCAQDASTGELTGALKDYLEYASTAFENAQLNFETVSFPTVAEAIKALKKGEIDCVFPSNLTDYDAERLSLVITPPLMHTEMAAVVRASEQKEFLRNEKINVAVNEGNTNYDIFLKEHYPDWQKKYFPDTSASLEAVAHKEADCVVISSYRYNNISKQCEKLHLTTIYTGVDMDYHFAIRAGETELYSILASVTRVVPDSVIHTALTYYSTEDVKTSVLQLIKENLFIITTVIAAVMFIIILLLLRSIRAEKKIIEEEHLVNDLNKRVFVDALTSVKNKGAFSDYIQKLQERVNQGEEPEFAVGIFDCNNLKTVNDIHGHDKGDLYLKAACQLICKVFHHSPVFRIGGDEFAVILQNEDYHNREKLMQLFEEKRKEICASAENKWDEVHIAAGIAVYDAECDSSVSDTMQRADKVMYENKRLIKKTAVR